MSASAEAACARLEGQAQADMLEEMVAAMKRVADSAIEKRKQVEVKDVPDLLDLLLEGMDPEIKCLTSKGYGDAADLCAATQRTALAQAGYV